MFKKWEKKILNLPIVQNSLKVLKERSIWGFDEVPIFYVGQFFFQAISKGTLSTRAASMAFRFFLAIFPGLIFLLTLIPLVPIDDFQNTLISEIETILPDGVKEFTLETIYDLISNPRGGILSINFLLALYFATNGIYTMMQEFNNTALFNDKRSFIKQQIIALGLTIVIVHFLLLAVVLITFTGTAIEYALSHDFFLSDFSIWLINAAKWIIVVALYYFAIAFLYYFGPANRKNWKFFSTGSSVATILLIVISLLFSYYVNHFSQYNKIYGSIGTVMIVMLYMFYNSYILLLGFELNASISAARQKRQLKENQDSLK